MVGSFLSATGPQGRKREISTPIFFGIRSNSGSSSSWLPEPALVDLRAGLRSAALCVVRPSLETEKMPYEPLWLKQLHGENRMAPTLVIWAQDLRL